MHNIQNIVFNCWYLLLVSIQLFIFVYNIVLYEILVNNKNCSKIFIFWGKVAVKIKTIYPFLFLGLTVMTMTLAITKFVPEMIRSFNLAIILIFVCYILRIAGEVVISKIRNNWLCTTNHNIRQEPFIKILRINEEK